MILIQTLITNFNKIKILLLKIYIKKFKKLKTINKQVFGIEFFIIR
jgi:hypothetical protein